MSKQGFTLLEVMIAAALLSIVTAGAMAAFVAQSRATNTQSSVSEANDRAREAIRLISNDVRTAAAGITPGAGGFASCAPGSIPFDTGVATFPGGIACLPPVFRSSLPMLSAATPNGLGVITSPNFNASGCGAGHPGYQLSFGSGVTVPPSSTAFFCPDDLVVLAVDDTQPLFMVQSGVVSSKTNAAPILFAGTNTGSRTTSANVNAGYGFDLQPPNIPTIASTPLSLLSPMMVFGGASSAVLMNVACTNCTTGGALYAAGVASCVTGSNCFDTSYGIIPWTTQVDLATSNLSFGSVGLPARLVQYSIAPVDAQGGQSGPLVSANLIRSVVVPTASAATPFTIVSSTILIQGVLDMQVEFGFPDPTAPTSGNLVYLNSGGLQSTPWIPPATAPAPSTSNPDNCFGGTTDSTVFAGDCFPTNGGSLNVLGQMRTVRLSLTVRAGNSVLTTQGPGQTSTATHAAQFVLQPGVQDLPTGNAEATAWGFATPWNPGTPLPFPGVFLTPDGADYRQVSTEIYVRNLGWTNNL